MHDLYKGRKKIGHSYPGGTGFYSTLNIYVPTKIKKKDAPENRERQNISKLKVIKTRLIILFNYVTRPINFCQFISI